MIDRTNGGVSHSESQGYGMLLAVAANDRAAFEAIWAWTQAHLYVRGDNLASWKWDPAATPHVADPNNATDGDLLIAWRWCAPIGNGASPPFSRPPGPLPRTFGRP